MEPETPKASAGVVTLLGSPPQTVAVAINGSRGDQRSFENGAPKRSFEEKYWGSVGVGILGGTLVWVSEGEGGLTLVRQSVRPNARSRKKKWGCAALVFFYDRRETPVPRVRENGE